MQDTHGINVSSGENVPNICHTQSRRHISQQRMESGFKTKLGQNIFVRACLLNFAGENSHKTSLSKAGTATPRGMYTLPDFTAMAFSGRCENTDNTRR